MSVVGASPEPPRASARYRVVDLVRGLAIIGVVLYHFSWDLGYYEAIPWQVPMGPGGKSFARSLALTFLFLVGVSLVLAHRHGFQAGPFWRRLARIGGFALVITVGTWFAFPDAWVYFGILHAIVVASILAVPFLRAPWWVVLGAAAFVIVLPQVYASHVFDPRWLAGTGLAVTDPLTVDLQPVFPRFAATLLGVLGGRLLLHERARATVGAWRLADPVSRFLVRCGRWSLWIYLAHQPVLFALLWLVIQTNGGHLAVLWR